MTERVRKWATDENALLTVPLDHIRARFLEKLLQCEQLLRLALISWKRPITFGPFSRQLDDKRDCGISTRNLCKLMTIPHIESAHLTFMLLFMLFRFFWAIFFYIFADKSMRGVERPRHHQIRDRRCSGMRTNYKTNYNRYLKAALYINNIIYLAVSP